MCSAEFDVCSSSGHLCGYGDASGESGVGDDACFFFVVFCVEDDAVDSDGLECVLDVFGFGDVVGSDEDGAADLLELLDVFDDTAASVVGGAEDSVCFVVANAGHVGVDDGDAEAVELAELFGGGGCGSGHSAEVGVAAEERLDGDGVEYSSAVGDVESFFGFDGGL